MYHLELRQFPHNFCRFNLDEQELRSTILDAWVRGEWVELGERKWNAQQASLTVLEGPRLPFERLSMGRGWRNAVREGQDVTEALLVGVRAEHSKEHQDAEEMPEPRSGAIARSRSENPTGDLFCGAEQRLDMKLEADSLGLNVLMKLGEEPTRLAFAWELASGSHPTYSASESLRLAEQAVRSLVLAGLVVLFSASVSGEFEPCSSCEQIERTLGAISSWTSAGAQAATLHKT